MGAFLQVYRAAGWELGDSPSDRFDQIVVVNLRGSLKPNSSLPAYKLVAHERYPTHPALIPIGADGEAVWCGPSSNFAGGESTPGWCEAVAKITGGVANLVKIYDDGFTGGAA